MKTSRCDFANCTAIKTQTNIIILFNYIIINKYITDYAQQALEKVGGSKR